MTTVELRKKSIDPLTGSDRVEKRVFKINEMGDPRDSIVFHQTASLLGINAFDRANPHVYRKLAIIYNWAANKSKDNDPNKVVEFIDKYKSKLGLNSVGPTLLDNIYMKIRMELDKASSQKTYEAKQSSLKEIAGGFKKDIKRTRELKGEISDQAAATKREEGHAQEVAKKSLEAWRDSLPKDRSIKLQVIEDRSSDAVLV